MNYLSTKQISELWGISTRRVVFLASSGRVNGAKQIDGRWFIPEDASKPLPPVKGEPEGTSINENKDNYCFPFLLACVHSDKQIENFTEEEKVLYEVGLVYESGDFQEAIRLSETLLDSGNIFIRLGALYYLSFLSLYTEDFSGAEKYTLLFKTTCHEVSSHDTEIKILNWLFDLEMFSLSEYLNYFEKIDLKDLPEDLFPLVASLSLFSELLKIETEGKFPNITPYKILLREIESQGFYFYAMYIHACLSAYYSVINFKEEALFHMKRAVDIAIEHGIYFTISCYIISNVDIVNEVLKEYPREITAKFPYFSGIFLNVRNNYAKYHGKKAVFEKLTADDYALISFCVKNVSIDKIAKSLGVSRSTVNNRLNSLYKKVGVNSKKDLERSYVDFLID